MLSQTYVIKVKKLKINFLFFNGIHKWVYIYMERDMIQETKQHLTSVKVDSEVFNEFKILCIKYKFSLQKLSDRSIHSFVNDEEFRKKILNYSIPKP